MFEGATPENLIYLAEALVTEHIEPTRRQLGAHYTSEANIMKVIRPLFLDEWTEKVEQAIASKNAHLQKNTWNKLRNLTFLDPACGCGNFLIVTFRELRRLEHKLVKEMGRKKNEISISALNFKGLEISEFPAKVAEAALWMMEQLMELEGARALEVADSPHLPLPKEKVIRVCDALAVEWPHVDYIMGNPPFVGSKMMTDIQRETVREVTGLKSTRLDFVSVWFVRAADCIRESSKVRASFVSTNSLNQGELKSSLVKLLSTRNVGVQFSPTFVWSNEASKSASVHCSIGTLGADVVSDVCVSPRSKPLSCGSPVLRMGSKATDDGNLLLSLEEKDNLLESHPECEAWVRPYKGARDFIRGDLRYCLWLLDVSPSLMAKVPLVLNRIESVKKFRSLSKSKTTRELGDSYLFQDIRQPEKRFLAFPQTSSSRREYVPLAFLPAEVVVSNGIYTSEDVSEWQFALIMSSLYMSWFRNTTGRMKSDYQFSPGMSFNTFVWPELTDQNKEQLTKLGQAILDARANHPDCNLADLYDPLTMPADLRKAHNANDKYVDSLYGLKDATEETRLAELMKRYQEAVKPR